MTITCQLETVAASIAALSISGMNIKGIDNIPQSANGLTPLLIPQPNDFVTNLSPTRVSFGGGGTAKMDLTYTLHYVYLHAEAGSGLSTYAVYAGLIANFVAIIEAILENDDISGAVDMELGNVGDIGIISDPSDNEFWGVLFELNILEHVQ